ncbi:MAG: lipopolysaccharide core heptose(I) kinase RfaP [Gammaproteobacteria bacterium]|nr:lipopolysaccharide core heptose(I) kinase RfaP [Gammaproteobacteria bacterium]
MHLYLRDDIEAAARSGALGASVPPGAAIAGDVAASVFEALFALTGEVYRQTQHRRTLRCEIAGRAYFAKLHGGVGWREIATSWAVGKRPVIGAADEYRACSRLADAGVLAPGVAAFGESGDGPAAQRSLVVCDALDGFVSLEEIANDWALNPRPTAVKRRLLVAVADLASRMHAAGVFHRDFYLCHLLANAAKLADGDVELAVIDLHRALVAGQRAPSVGARVRDLAALCYSAEAVPLVRTDVARFVGTYTGQPAARAVRGQRRFWAAVRRRADRLRARAAARGLATGTAALDPHGATAVSIGKLSDVGRAPSLPFRFDADFGDGGRRVVCTDLLRVQPGRRLVARARLGASPGDDVIVKAFFGRRGKRDCRRERRGHQALESTGVAVPRLRSAGRGAGAHVLAFEPINAARALGMADLVAVVSVLARLHAGGVRQRDLHLGNFVVAAGAVYAVDGGGARRQRMGRRGCFRDVARLLAGGSPEWDVADAVDTYAKVRGWTLSPRERGQVDGLLAAARRREAVRLARKSVRDCTPFAVHSDAGGLTATARDDRDPELEAVFADPERAIATGEPLKRGRTATVVRCGGLVVKRYNVKSRAHRWRLKVGASRARKAWQTGHGLRLLGVPTARPRALLERLGAAPGSASAYLVLDYVDGTSLADLAVGRTANLVSAVRELFAGLRMARVAHGDMKATNLILADGKVHVVDLDAAVWHRNAWWFRRRHQRDRERFRRNFPAVAATVREALVEAAAGARAPK